MSGDKTVVFNCGKKKSHSVLLIEEGGWRRGGGGGVKQKGRKKNGVPQSTDNIGRLLTTLKRLD